MSKKSVSPKLLRPRGTSVRSAERSSTRRALTRRTRSGTKTYANSNRASGRRGKDVKDINPFKAKARGVIGAKRTGLEKLMARALSDMGVQYKEQVPVGPYVCDFWLPQHNMIVEVDGAYWHETPLRKAKDAKKDKYLMACGYRVSRFQEWAVTQSPKACVRIALRVPNATL